nr:hypothetical protein CFP56_03629 [Quercus suber]
MQSFLTTLLLLCSCFDILGGALGDVGTARYYGPPYLPTKCYGDDQDQFPSDGHFAAVSNGIWDNGAACEQQWPCHSKPLQPSQSQDMDLIGVHPSTSCKTNKTCFKILKICCEYVVNIALLFL